jgi:hypothetical protein
MRVLRSLGVEVTVALPSATEGLASRYREAGVEIIQVDLDLHMRDPRHCLSTLQSCRAGWLVPSRKPSALARAILNALEHKDEARRRTAEGHRLAAWLFDVQRTGAEVGEIYKKILGAVS